MRAAALGRYSPGENNDMFLQRDARVVITVAVVSILALTTVSLAVQSQDAMEKVSRGIELMQERQIDRAPVNLGGISLDGFIFRAGLVVFF